MANTGNLPVSAPVRSGRASSTQCVCLALVFFVGGSCAPLVAATITNQIPSLSQGVYEASAFNVGLGFGTVGDRVAYSPNLPDGGFSDPVSKPRYESHSVSAHWQVNSKLSVGGLLAQRNFTSLRDDFKFNSYRVDVSYRLPAIAVDTITSLDFSIGSNRASRLDKNSYTQIGENLLRQVSVNSPSDLHWRASLSQNHKLTKNTRYTFFSGVGQTLSRHDGIEGSGVDSTGCVYDFQFFSEGGTVDQRDACGAIQSMNRVYPDELSIERDLSVAPQRDMENNAWFYRVGGNLTSSYNSWQTSLGFYHQRYVRDLLDQRIRNFGGEVLNANNVVTLQATRFMSGNLSYTATLEYNQHQFLDELPVLYTRLTSDRFSNDVVHMTVSVNYLFRR